MAAYTLYLLYLQIVIVVVLLTPGTHDFDVGGNPLAIAISTAALDVLKDEQLVERSERLGSFLLKALLQLKHPKY